MMEEKKVYYTRISKKMKIKYNIYTYCMNCWYNMQLLQNVALSVYSIQVQGVLLYLMEYYILWKNIYDI